MGLTLTIYGGSLKPNINIGDMVEIKFRVDSKTHTYKYAYVTEIDVQVGSIMTADGFVAKYLDVDEICYLIYSHNESWWRKL